MSRKVKPLNVSPVIRSARYISLFCGIAYGIMKWSALKAYEASVKPKRDKIFRENNEHRKIVGVKNTKEDIKNLAKQLDLTDLPPDWDSDLK